LREIFEGNLEELPKFGRISKSLKVFEEISEKIWKNSKKSGEN